MIKNILFDFGNVLIDINIPASVEALKSIEGIMLDKFELLNSKYNWFNRYEVGDMTEESFINAIQRCYKPVPEGQVIKKAINAMLIGIPAERLLELEKLRKDYQVFLVSNTNETHLDWVYRHLKNVHGITDFDTRYFNKTYYSHLIGQRKPTEAFFDYVLKDAKIKAAESLFIDDIAENTASAKKLGFNVFHHDPQYEIMEILPSVIKNASK